jgi:hypothetical protein
VRSHLAPYLHLSTLASNARGPVARWLAATAVLLCFELASLGLGGAVVVIWPTPIGMLVALALTSLISVAGGVFTGTVMLRGGETS